MVPQQADIFLIPLLNGAYGVGQAVVCSPDTPLGTAACIITKRQVKTVAEQAPIHLSEALSLVLVKDDLIESGTWPVVGFESIPPIEKAFKIKKAIKTRFDRVAIQDPAVIEAFVNAIHGHFPWDGFPDPQLFTKLLISPDAIPSTATSAAELNQS